MNINRITQLMESYQPTARKPAAKTGKNLDNRDEISISHEAKLYEYAKKTAQVLPDIREDKVAAIAKRMENGSYYVSSADLARKMLD